MELENKVPVDIGRRKVIARLLKIPPMLFGLAVLEDMTWSHIHRDRYQAYKTSFTRVSRYPFGYKYGYYH